MAQSSREFKTYLTTDPAHADILNDKTTQAGEELRSAYNTHVLKEAEEEIKGHLSWSMLRTFLESDSQFKDWLEENAGGGKLRTATFTTTGEQTWVAPIGVNRVFITGCGAGGGGSDVSSGTAGGATSFGALLTLPGGGGATAGDGLAGAGGGVLGGSGYDPASPDQMLKPGGASLFGSSFTYPNSSGTGPDQPLRGSGGGTRGSNATRKTGGGGDYCIKRELTVVPETSYTITIGVGGAGGTNGGGRGGDGYMRVEWYE